MEITGKIIVLLSPQSGKTANGEWRKQEYILETDSQYPKKICFMAWGDKIEQFGIKLDEKLTVSVDLESREYNGRWYTDVKAWKISRHTFDANNSPIHDNQNDINQLIKNDNSYDNSDIPF